MKAGVKVLLALTAGVALAVLLPALLLGSAILGLRADTEICRVPSPDGSCYAVVIESNHGATGGATYVEVKKPFTRAQRVYSGPWSQARSLRVEWQDDQTLLINGVAYAI